MKKYFLLVLLLAVSFWTLQAQQNLRVMSYNLLNYGNYWGDCTISNNNIENKKDYIHTIVEYVQPDIFAAVEMDAEAYNSVHLLGNALNVNGETKWKKGNPPNNSNAYMVNQIFYNSERLQLTTSIGIQTNIRDINMYRFKIIDASLGEEVFINCFVAHLKAGQDYASERKAEIALAMNYINAYGLDGNNLFMGDFNFYSSNEAGYLQLLNFSNAEIRFYDPINKPGNWNNNSYFKNYHTQSTHEWGDCPSGGGMDDRFDFILISDEIKNGTEKVVYAENSYTTIGQDGNHFNEAINNGNNNSVPSNVLSALYNNSDHLPVVLNLSYGEVGIEENALLSKIQIQNPAKDKLRYFIANPYTGNIQYKMMDMTGRIFSQGEIESYFSGSASFSIDKLEAGFYLLEFTADKNRRLFKVVVE